MKRNLLAWAALGFAAAACGSDAPEPGPVDAPAVQASAQSVAYVGTARCASCHADAFAAWRGSHHDQAMQEATPEAVLGNFDGARFEHFGSASTFFRRDGRFFVRTEGADGAPAEFEIAYAFGVEPLQQYLVRFPKGHVQAFGIAWDSRPKAAGGQRWFHLYPEAPVRAGDVLHWTQPAQRWNTQCAACHSTNLRKGYDLERDAYDTTFAEIDVACEACHGPGSKHAAWAEAARGSAGTAADLGLTVELPPARREDWVLEPGASIAKRRVPRAEHAELDTCAPCHARRSQLDEAHRPGDAFFDGYRPALLEGGLYEADGQMRGEVYEVGSFLQSRMHAAGVTCGDCHDAHSLRLRAEGNALCGQCHRSEVFETEAHHHHPPASAGAQCASCHMPARTYMGVDVRHEHAFRVPRPDLSVAVGTPNACTDCHTDRSARWAAERTAAWFPNGRAGSAHFATALDAGRRGLPGAAAALAAVAEDASQPAIVRASALALVAPSRGAAGLAALGRGLADPSPWVRMGALEAVSRFDAESQLAASAGLLRDPLRALRIDAAQALAPLPAALWSPGARAALERPLAEYRAVQAADADRPEAHVNLGALHAAWGEPEAARSEYQIALRLAPWFVPASINLADLDRALGRDADAEAQLRRALATVPDSADLHHALGLALVRLGRRAEALTELERAATLAPEISRFAYALGLALHDAGQVERALEVLMRARRSAPGDRDVGVALAMFTAQAGRAPEAAALSRQLAADFPDDPEVQSLAAQLASQI